MIHEYEITIGSILRTNKGEIIRVESISTKRQHRKVGYHTPDDPYRIKYVRLAQCDGVELTPEILIANGFRESIEEGNYYFPERYKELNICGFALDSDNEGRWMITDHQLMIFMYVHELQRALFCAGLHELAMKIKIE